MLSYTCIWFPFAFICFQTLFAFICFQTLSYAFIYFHTFSYAFIRLISFHLLSNMPPYTFVCFYMLSYAFTMLYKPLHALEAKVSQQEEEARCSAVYRLFLRKPVKGNFTGFLCFIFLRVHLI